MSWDFELTLWTPHHVLHVATCSGSSDLLNLNFYRQVCTSCLSTFTVEYRETAYKSQDLELRLYHGVHFPWTPSQQLPSARQLKPPSF